ncbi:MAG: hypothetical protein KAT15_14795, partial [Bacteroidales bacterium]|nr:hypothetical protein [Bacteroidales bacterium]
TSPVGDIEILIALNSSETAPEEVLIQNTLSENEIREFARVHSDEKFRILLTHKPGIRAKEAGAGLARKIAMDHALSRFNSLGKPEGIILSLDADTLCEQNYLSAVEEHFRSNTGSRACSIYFEHPLEGSVFPAEVYQGITQYELHLRYYIQGLRYAGHPHAYHTVGSAFGIRAGVYASQGGMNKRPAGEDFYFLQKIIPLGNFHDLDSTSVRPSPRPSGRVAFGTGPVVQKFLSGDIDILESYNPQSFYDLKEFLAGIPLLYSANQKEIRTLFGSWPESIQANLEGEFFSRLEEIRKNSGREITFGKRFFRWFNMFRTLKYMNYVSRQYYPRMPVSEAVVNFLNKTGQGIDPAKDARSLLIHLRKVQREGSWPD